MSTWLLVWFASSYTKICSTCDVALYTRILFGRKHGRPRKPIASVLMTGPISSLCIRSVLICPLELQEIGGGPGSEATGFEVVKYGGARIALIGFASVSKVGQSTALSLLTATGSEAASYEVVLFVICG
jgi:hypothetical protein